MCASGKFQKMSDEEIIEILETANSWAGRPFTSAHEIADRTDMTRQAVRERLEDLVTEKEDVKRYKPSRDVIYWMD
jgi:predicted ArsR family transcriptional regulator